MMHKNDYVLSNKVLSVQTGYGLRVINRLALGLVI